MNSKLSTVFAIFTIFCVLDGVYGVECPPGSVDVPGRDYCVLFTSKMTFSEAQEQCRGVHGILYQPIDIYDDRLIGSLMENYSTSHYAWIGAIQSSDGSLQFTNGEDAGTKHQVFGIFPFCSQNPGGFSSQLRKCVEGRQTSDACDNYINRMECGIQTVGLMSHQPEKDVPLVQAFVHSFHSYINPAYLNHTFGEGCEEKFLEVINATTSPLFPRNDSDICVMLRSNGRWYFANCSTPMNAVCMIPKMLSCPQGWSYLTFSNACYKIGNSPTPVSQSEAENLCLNDGSHLVSLTSTQEILSVLGMVMNTNGTTNDRFWTGIVCSENQEWEWNDGNPVTFNPLLDSVVGRKRRDVEATNTAVLIDDTAPPSASTIDPPLAQSQCPTGSGCTLNPSISSLAGAPVFGFSFQCQSTVPSSNYICKIQM